MDLLIADTCNGWRKAIGRTVLVNPLLRQIEESLCFGVRISSIFMPGILERLALRPRFQLLMIRLGYLGWGANCITFTATGSSRFCGMTLFGNGVRRTLPFTV